MPGPWRVNARSADSTPQAVQACHALLCWGIPVVHAFPRAFRFTLGERLEQRLLTVLERLLEATYTRDKRALLGRANLELDVARHGSPTNSSSSRCAATSTARA